MPTTDGRKYSPLQRVVDQRLIQKCREPVFQLSEKAFMEAPRFMDTVASGLQRRPCLSIILGTRLRHPPASRCGSRSVMEVRYPCRIRLTRPVPHGRSPSACWTECSPPWHSGISHRLDGWWDTIEIRKCLRAVMVIGIDHRKRPVHCPGSLTPRVPFPQGFPGPPVYRIYPLPAAHPSS